MRVSLADGRRRGPSGPRRRWPRRLALAALATLAATAFLGFYVAPPIVRNIAETRLGALLGRRVTLAGVRLNPFALSATIEGGRVYERDGRTVFFAFSRLFVNVQASSLVHRGLVVRELRLESPRARIVRERAAAEALDGYNFSDIVARLRPREGAAEAPDEAPPRFSLSNIRVVDGAASYEDRPTGSQHEIAGLELGVPFISTLPADTDVFVAPALRVQIDGAPFRIDARSKPFEGGARETVAEVRLSNLDLARLAPLVPVRLPVVVDSAALGADLDAAFTRRPGEAPTLRVRGRVTLERVDVHAPAGTPRARLAALEVRIRDVDVAAGLWAFDAVTVRGLDVRARRLRDGTFDWQRLWPPRRAARAPRRSAERGAPPRIEIGEVAIEGTAAHLRDEAVRPPVDLDIEPVELTARGLSNQPGARGEVTLSLQATPGLFANLRGTLALAPFAAAGALDVEASAVGRLEPYFREQVAVEIPKGRVRVAGRYRIAAGRAGTSVNFSSLSLDVTGLVARRRGTDEEPFLRLPNLAVRDAAVDVGARDVSVGLVRGRGGRVRLVRDTRGKLALRSLVPREAGAERAPEPGGPPWTVAVRRVELEGWEGRYEDDRVAPRVRATVSSLSVRGSHLHFSPDLRGTLEVEGDVGARGHIKASGALSLRPLALSASVDLRDGELAPFGGYLSKPTGATVTSGVASVKGKLVLALPGDDEPDRSVRLEITGGLDVSDLAAASTSDGKALAGLSALHVAGFSLTLQPVRLAIREGALTAPWTRLIIAPDGTFSLGGRRSTARSPSPAPRERAPGPARAPASIVIGQLSVRRGRARFIDRSVHPAFLAELADIDARVAGIATTPGTLADLTLKARVNRAASLTVAGKLNPIDGKLALDLRASLGNLDLPPVSPYAAKFLGYEIDKGKLGLGVVCHAARGELAVNSRIVIQQLRLGREVESPSAINVPVSLAVSVLKDRGGVIDFELPVRGSLDDPHFNLGQTIRQAVYKLLGKVVTAPLAMLGSIFRRGGGGDETSAFVEFPPGGTGLDAATGERLATLARVLRERPGVSFEIVGRADPARDAEGVRRFLASTRLPNDAVNREDALVALARKRAGVVRETLMRAAPESTPRLYLVAPRVGQGQGSRVELRVR
jgi:hypothetical protein